MEFIDKMEYIIAVKERFKEQIAFTANEEVSELLGLWSCDIQLNDGFSKDDVIEDLTEFGLSKIKFTDALIFWINNPAEEFEKFASPFFVNGDSNDDGKSFLNEDYEAEHEVEQLFIVVDGKQLKVHYVNDDDQGWFTILQDDVHLLKVKFEGTTAAKRWRSDNDFTQEYVDKIGKEIEMELMQEIDEPFEIVVNNQAYLVIPLEDQTFDIYIGSKRLGNIHADIGIDTEPDWNTGDLIPLEEVAAIGYAIEMKEM